MVIPQHLEDNGEGLDDGSRRGCVWQLGNECWECLREGVGVGEDEIVVILGQWFFGVELELVKRSVEGFLWGEREGEGEDGFEHSIEAATISQKLYCFDNYSTIVINTTTHQIHTSQHY